MKNFKKSARAFTLVEMLVVIAIISLLSLGTMRMVRSMRRQANAVKCQANMKNLHTAVVSFLADKGHYPLASSYETSISYYDTDGNKHTSYYEERGWVSWLPRNGSKRRDEHGQTVWRRDDNRKSHAAEYEYYGNCEERTMESIEEGSLFKYAGENLETYRCPEHVKAANGAPAHLAYAMNHWFGCHNDQNNTRFSKGRRRTPNDVSAKDSSRLALFVEIDEPPKKNPTSRPGKKAGEEDTRSFKDDCVWMWTNPVEIGRFTHRKSNKNYTHVVFLDGHVASVSDRGNDSDNIKEFHHLGEGTY